MADKKHFHNKQKKIDTYKPPFPDGVLAEPISNLDLRKETFDLLSGANVSTVGDVLKRTETDFYKIIHFNKKNLFDVKEAVRKRNLFLKPMPEKDNASNENGKQQDNRQRQNQNGQRGQKQSAKSDSRPQDKNGNSHDNNDKNGRKNKEKEAPYVMKTLPEKPPRPTKAVIKEEPDRYVKINKGGLWGFKERNSKEIPVPPVYDEVFSFKDDLCCVQKDEKFGFINRQGEEIIPIVYDCATSFSEGLACVYKGEVCGYIDKNGETVIEFKFDAGTPVIGGECRVKKSGRWGELHVDKPNEIRWIV